MFRNTILSLAAAMLICGAVIGAARAETNQANVEHATKAAAAWLKLVDDGNYRASWEQASTLFKGHVTEQEWEQKLGAARKPLGNLVSRKLRIAQYATSLPGAPDGQYVVIEYDSSFVNKKSAVESVTPMIDKDGGWHVSGYYIR